MAPTTLVEQVQLVLDRLRVEKGEFFLAMLYSGAEEGEGAWSLIVSAPWAEEMKLRDVVRLLAERLREGLAPEIQNLISRVTVLDAKDGFVSSMNSAFAVRSPGSIVDISNSSFGGVRIPRGVLFYSQRPVSADAR